MLGVDVRGSSQPSRDDSVLPALRRAQTTAIADALSQQGVDSDCYVLRSRGDGGRYDFLPHISPVPVVEALIGPLPPLLRRHNKQSSEAMRLGLRLVVHGGYLVPTPDGGDADGGDVNLLHGMLDADELRQALAESGLSSVVAVSEEIWNGVVRHGHGDLDPDLFGETRLTVKGGKQVAAWLTPAPRGPRAPGTAEEPERSSRRAEKDTTPGAGEHRGGGGITFHDVVKAENVVNGPQINFRNTP
ncbi:hypothetical protein [Streptomyces gilvus]|uniref:hypothetical protein n=1 Tax=Streptomyces gilvus TaxID=2920937 RepID=UPI001F0E527E|nr:hypothetical protein [Streptomyces sp. CME 23]MCH5677355.1 hypothetical protein [Streptomyces sp. CME 23]